MKIKLSTDEKIIKLWNYAKEQVDNKQYDATLTVTNKRIISVHQSSRCTSRSEVFLSDVQGLNCFHGRQGTSGTIVLLILGLLMALSPLTLIPFGGNVPLLFQILGEGVNDVLFTILCCVLCGIGIIFVISTISILSHGLFCLEILTDSNQNSSLVIGNESINVFNRNANNSIKINVTKKVAGEIFEDLGALIAEYRK